MAKRNRKQIDIANTAEGWEAGFKALCFDGSACRMQPCTTAQQVACCGQCQHVRSCLSKCERMGGVH